MDEEVLGPLDEKDIIRYLFELIRPSDLKNSFERKDKVQGQIDLLTSKWAQKNRNISSKTDGYIRSLAENSSAMNASNLDI